MPVDFEKCRAEGGRIRTIKPKGPKAPEYMPVCYDKAGKSHAGEVKRSGPHVARLGK